MAQYQAVVDVEDVQIRVQPQLPSSSARLQPSGAQTLPRDVPRNMDPLSVVAASFSTAGAVAKASVAIFEFSRVAKVAAEDLARVNAELQALSSILDPLARGLSRATVPDALARKLQASLEDCSLVVDGIRELVEAYQRDGAWTRTKWVVFGRGDIEKLRVSLEAYKMALGLGLHAVSM